MNRCISYVLLFILLILPVFYFICFSALTLNTLYVIYVLCLVALHCYEIHTFKPTLNKASSVLYKFE